MMETTTRVPSDLICAHRVTYYERAFIKKETCGACQRQLLAKDPLYLCSLCRQLLCRGCLEYTYGGALSLYPSEYEDGSLARGTSLEEKAYQAVCERCGVFCEVTTQDRCSQSLSSKRLCLKCRTPVTMSGGSILPCDDPCLEDTQLFYKNDQLCYRDGRGKERRVSPKETGKLLLQPSLMKERLAPHTGTVQGAQSAGNQRLWKFTSRPSAPRPGKGFLFIEAQKGEQCVIVPGGSDPLTWLFNTEVIHKGTNNCCRFTASCDTTGVYLCLTKTREPPALICIVRLKSLDGTGPGARRRPLGKDELFFPADNASLSEDCNCPDIPGAQCRTCQARDNIFRSPRNVENISSEMGSRVVLTVAVCECAVASYSYTWSHNGQEIPHVTGYTTEFELSAMSGGAYLCLACDWNSNKPIYSSQPFIVKVEKAGEVVSESIEESTPNQCSTVILPIPVLSYGALEQRGRDKEEMSIVPRRENQRSPLQDVPVVPLPVPDSEPIPKPDASAVVHQFLTAELLPCVSEPRFNMVALANSPLCQRSIGDIILKIWDALDFDSEKEFMQKVILTICCETAADMIGIRRCEVLCYDLIISLERHQGNAFHQSIGEAMRQRAPFRPYISEWQPGRSLCLPCGEFVAFQVKAFNADKYEWVQGCQVVCQEPRYFIRVAPETCDTYQCWVTNCQGTVQTPPVTITMSDERTSCSETAGVCKATFESALPSHELRDLAPIEATECSQAHYSEMAVSRACGSEQVVPGSHRGVHNHIERTFYSHPIRRNEPQIKLPATRSSVGHARYPSPHTVWPN